ncbi:trypsin-like serine peptidase [Tessaracoccus palaemonis]|uniref:Serine protease n=1 Tax=Tessaracoccus palaemonis TaxID=2829499 RepID=A0ABX8SIG5_9ACTN|nr:trypsin-like peptidase domain-containing protein [Tessaracoccus palaemonis]QXT63172.1 serine protease [Tessaracoccus palaemonis]
MALKSVCGSAAAAALLLLAGCTGVTPPAPITPAPSATPVTPVAATPADPLPLADLAAFSGVVSLNAGSNCSGTLIDTGATAGPAYVLTNGHCIGDVGRSPQTTTHELDWFGTAEFLAAEGNLDATLSVDVVKLEYSTMRHTDTGIVRLDATLGELEDLGIRPVKIADAEPLAGQDVVNVGVPVQDLDQEEWVLRRGDCTLGAQHTLIEGRWLWFDAWSNDCPGIIQGSSGSPVLSVDTDGNPTGVVAMINTTTWGGTAANGGACSMNHPCEVTADGASMVEETSYAQSVAGLGKCFDDAGVFRTGGACPLPDSSVWAETGGGTFQGGDVPDATGATPQVSLVGRTAGTVRTALVPLGDGSACTSATTYASAEPQELPEAAGEWDLVGAKISVDLPETEGRFLFCAVSGNDYAGAASVLFDVDRTPPIFAAAADVEDIGGGTMIVRPHLVPPEIQTVRFTWGAPDEVDCDDPTTFQDFFIVPLTLEASDLPATYCLYGLDSAGNATDVTRIEIPGK